MVGPTARGSEPEGTRFDSPLVRRCSFGTNILEKLGFGDQFGVGLGSFWDGLEIVLGWFGCRFGMVWGWLGDVFWIVLDRVKAVLRWFGDCFGIRLGSSEDCFGHFF